jgi:hypothetical protein
MDASRATSLANNLRQPYCMAVVAPKAAKLREKFRDRLRDKQR